MKNTTWVFGSMLAAGCMMLSVPVTAQGNFPQGMPQGMPAGFPQGGAPGGMPAGFPQAGAPGKANTAGAKPASTAGKTNTATKSNTTNKAALEAAKYQLSNHRTDLIRATIDGYASDDDLTDRQIVRDIMEDIEKHMPLVPSVPLEKADLQALNEQAKKMVDQEYGADDKQYASVVEAEAAAEFPLYKVGDTVVVNYNMGPKHFSVKGKLYRITDSSITVEDKIINFVDLNDETRSRFDLQKNRYMRDRYKETHIHLLNRIKIEKRNDYFEKLKGEIFGRNETAGYIYDSQTGEWSTAQEVAKNYIDRILRDRAKTSASRPKPSTQVKSNETVADNGGQDTEPADDTQPDETVGQGGTAQAGITPVNDAIKLEDNAESRAKYKSVIAKAEKQKKNANENYAGIDADCGYKDACWVTYNCFLTIYSTSNCIT